MAELPEDLRTYLQAVHDANERIIATKRRQMEPTLQDDDHPWLAAEQSNMAGMLRGYADHFGDVKRDEHGAVIDGDPDAGDAHALALFDSLVSDPGKWETWEDVFGSAERMNRRIEELLGS